MRGGALMDEARLRKALARFDEMENYLLMKDLRRSMRDYATPDVALFIAPCAL